MNGHEPNNPYTPPEAPLGGGSEDEERLAGRGVRLGAALIDGLLVGMITVPAMIYSGYWAQVRSGIVPPFTSQLLWALIGFAVFMAFHGYSLKTSGQTLGKKLLGIQIQCLDGSPFRLPQLGLRYLLPQLLGLVPVAGPLFGILNLLFIFGPARRCLHDYLAGTCVVNLR